MINVVGNAKSIFEDTHGELIDSGQVIRFNWGGILDSTSQGSKTNAVITAERYIDRVKEVYPSVPIIPTDTMPYANKSKHFIEDCEFTSSGFMVLFWFNESKVQDVNLFGFNWDNVCAYYDVDWVNHVHNYQEEKKLIHQWIEDNNWKLY